MSSFTSNVVQQILSNRTVITAGEVGGVLHLYTFHTRFILPLRLQLEAFLVM